MKVARHGVPGNGVGKESVPEGRYDRRPRGSSSVLTGARLFFEVLGNASDRDTISCRPSGTARPLAVVSRHSVPGYLHSVPPGQQSRRLSTFSDLHRPKH